MKWPCFFANHLLTTNIHTSIHIAWALNETKCKGKWHTLGACLALKNGWETGNWTLLRKTNFRVKRRHADRCSIENVGKGGSSGIVTQCKSPMQCSSPTSPTPINEHEHWSVPFKFAKLPKWYIMSLNKSKCFVLLILKFKAFLINKFVTCKGKHLGESKLG